MLHLITVISNKPGVVMRVAGLLAIISASLSVDAQTTPIHIRVLNGYNGKPIVSQQIFLNTDPRLQSSDSQPAITDSRGEVEAAVPSNGTIRFIVSGHPVCARFKKEEFAKENRGISVETILSAGVVRPNNCSRFTTTGKPGEVIAFVRPLHWWERLSD